MADEKTTANAGSGRESTKVRTAGDSSPGGRQRSAKGGVKARPAAAVSSRTGPGARLLAPVALVVCVIAVLSVLSAGGSETTKGGDAKQTSSGAKSPATEETSDSPAATGSTGPVRSTYRVKPGDSFSEIAQKTGVDADTLSELNPDVDARALQPGQKLKLK